MKKSRLSLALSLILILSSLAPTAYASEELTIQSRYSRITSFTVAFSISSSGLSSDYSSIKLTNSTDTVNLIIELQQKSGSTWSTIKTWETSGSGTVSLDKSWYVSSGYSYRIYVTAKVYNSSDTLSETATLISSTASY